MRLLTVHTLHFPPRNFHAITIFPFIFYKGSALSEQDLRHETVHLWQQALLLVIPLYLLYLAFWIVNLLRYRNSDKAYCNIPFERSAYRLEGLEGVPPLKQATDWLRCL